jgi:hypothetical protein
MSKRSRGLPALFIFAVSLIISTPALAHLQCVPYARDVSGIEIHGNAHTWWHQADGIYQRGSTPKEHAVMVFRSTPAMPFGHVAVVSRIVDARHVLLDHANWSRPGMIEHQALAEDVSEAGDWSEVRVWYDRSHGMGERINPVFGFIYNAPPQPAPAPVPDTQIVRADQNQGEVQLASAAG